MKKFVISASALVRSAAGKLAPLRFALTRIASVRSTLARFAYVKFESARLSLVRVASVRSARSRLIPGRITLVTLGASASARFAPVTSGRILKFSLRYWFQDTTPCFSRVRCFSFDIAHASCSSHHWSISCTGRCYVCRGRGALASLLSSLRIMLW